MKALNVLESKIAALVALIKELKTENAKLAEENAQVLAKLESIKTSALDDSKRVQNLDKEKALTKSLVDDLIKNIDSLVEQETQQ